MKSELSIVIVNWNGESFLPNCLESIKQNPPSVPYEVVVVDNKSTDSSLEWLKADDSQELLRSLNFRLIESAQNLGYGCGNNLAIEQTDSPVVLILNPDIVVLPNSIDMLLETLNADPDIGAVGPKLLNVDGSLHPSVSNFPPTPFSIVIAGLQLGFLFPRKFLAKRLYGQYWEHNERISVPIIQGAAMMIKRATIKQIGAFDPSIHMFGEELELCVRMNRNDWKIFFEPDAEMVHVGGKSTEQRWNASEIEIVKERAIIAYHRMCFSPALNFCNDLAEILVFSTHFARWALKRRDTAVLRALIKLHVVDCLGIVLGLNSPRALAEGGEV